MCGLLASKTCFKRWQLASSLRCYLRRKLYHLNLVWTVTDREQALEVFGLLGLENLSCQKTGFSP